MHNIYLLCLPTYMSHHMQPLDMGRFSLLKNYFRQAVRSMDEKGVKAINKRMLWTCTEERVLMHLLLCTLKARGGGLDSFPETLSMLLTLPFHVWVCLFRCQCKLPMTLTPFQLPPVHLQESKVFDSSYCLLALVFVRRHKLAFNKFATLPHKL